LCPLEGTRPSAGSLNQRNELFYEAYDNRLCTNWLFQFAQDALEIGSDSFFANMKLLADLAICGRSGHRSVSLPAKRSCPQQQRSDKTAEKLMAQFHQLGHSPFTLLQFII